MASNADAATGAVQMVTELQGKVMKITADITGDLSKDVLKLLFLVISNNNRTPEQQNLLDMMTNNDNGLKTITIKPEGVSQFSELANKEKLNFRTVQDISHGRAMIYFDVKDVDKVNRILEQMPATVKLDHEALLKSLIVEEQDKDQYMVEALGVYDADPVSKTKEDVTISEGRSTELPDSFVEHQAARLNETNETTVNFTQPTSSQDQNLQSSSSSSVTDPSRAAAPETPRVRSITPEELFRSDRTSVMAALNNDQGDHDIANNDIQLGETTLGVEIADTVGEER